MKTNTRLVQLNHPAFGRKVAVVDEPSLLLLHNFRSVYDLALEAINKKEGLPDIIANHLSQEKLEYDLVYEGQSEWSLLPSFDHPNNPFACLVSGTGLTHNNSAMNRQMMHAVEEGSLTDSMRMYLWGVEGGQPAKGTIGRQPEWFYKGTGAILKGHRQALEVPPYAEDGGEEPEVAGVYLIDKEGTPYRVGFTTGNEFSDHRMERQNYLYLAPSKLRSCAIGPELIIDLAFEDVAGEVRVLRNKEELWLAPINTGEQNMAHSLANLEYHHFKYGDHRQPFQSHVHFFGADAFSFGAGVTLQTGDEMYVRWSGMGRPLINPIVIGTEKEKFIEVNQVKGIS